MNIEEIRGWTSTLRVTQSEIGLTVHCILPSKRINAGEGSNLIHGYLKLLLTCTNLEIDKNNKGEFNTRMFSQRLNYVVIS